MELEFPNLNSGVIIATKGLPCSAKSVFGMIMGTWAKCQVLYIDHFLDAMSIERGYTIESPPSPDEAQRLDRLAFDALCKAASYHLRWGAEVKGSFRRVVIKSRLSSTFEVDRLVQLAKENDCGVILIVELRMENEFCYRYRVWFEGKVESGCQKEWYKPRRWTDIEKAMEEAEEDCPIWEQHLGQRLLSGSGLRVARMVFNPSEDFFIGPPAALTSGCAWAVKCLMFSLEEDCSSSSNKQGLLSVHYNQYQRSLVENQMRNASPLYGEQSRKLCKYACLFKCWEQLPDDNGKAYHCGVCEARVISGNPAYSCVNCFLLLHKYCAELPLFTYSKGIEHFINDNVHERHACASCREEGKGFSRGCGACLFQTHLKCRLLPTILNHDSHHDHPLTLSFSNVYVCKACRTERRFGNTCASFYSCTICLKCYDMECVGLVREVEHQHGGHDNHVLKLIYSHDSGRTQREEAYWCDVCYKDMDPQSWFYQCQQCPYFSAHPPCVKVMLRTKSGGRWRRKRRRRCGEGRCWEVGDEVNVIHPWFLLSLPSHSFCVSDVYIIYIYIYI